jgi:hypothetical protein
MNKVVDINCSQHYFNKKIELKNKEIIIHIIKDKIKPQNKNQGQGDKR